MVRCVRCGAPVDGYTQLCDNCSAEKREREENQRQQAIFSATMPCPFCKAPMSRAAPLCPTCGRDLASREAPHTADKIIRADFLIRFMAQFVDGLILVGAAVVISQFVDNVGTIATISAVLGACYAIGFWTFAGATPGKMLLGLKIIDLDHNTPIGPWQAIRRYIVHLFCNVWWLGYLMIFGYERLGPHDHFASTQVVFSNTLPKKEKKRRRVQPAA